MKTKPLRLALVGGGAVSQQGYLPALAKKWRIPEFTDDYDRALEAVEVVVLAALRSVYLS
jgi:hypothetical protein